MRTMKKIVAVVIFGILVVNMIVGTIWLSKQTMSLSYQPIEARHQLLPAVAATSDWPMFHYDPAHTGTTPSSGPTTNTVLWTYTTNGSVMSSPVVVNEKVYVGSYDNNVYCLNSKTGTLLWKYTTNGWVESTPAVSNGMVYVGSYDNYLYCLDAFTGDLLWNFETGSHITSSPTIANGKVYVSSLDGMVYCLRSNDGISLWNFSSNYEIRSSPAVVDGKLYIGSSDHFIYCLNAENGSPIWRYSGVSWWLSSPTVINNYVYIGSWDKKIYCLYASNGTKKWNFTTGDTISSSPAVSNGKLYIGSYDKKLYCLNADNGNLLWNYQTGSSLVFSSPAIANGKIYIGSSDKNIYCFDATTGAIVFSYMTGNRILSSPAIADGCLYIGSTDYKIYCLRENRAPNVPDEPDGSSTGSVNVVYPYSTASVDPDGDQLWYQWQFDNVLMLDWTGPSESGMQSQITHTWTSSGTHTIRVRAKDNQNAVSDWSVPLEITISTQPSELPLTMVVQSSVIEGNNFEVTILAGSIPLPECQVTFNNLIQSTDNDGKTTFTAPGVDRPLSYLISADKTGYTSISQVISVLPNKPETGYIYGVISDNAGSYIDNAQISIPISSDITKNILSDSEGRYVVSLAPGTYTVVASKNGYITQSIPNIVVKPKNATEINIELEQQTTTPTSPNGGGSTLDYVIQKEIQDGSVIGQLNMNHPGETPIISYYTDDLSIRGISSGNEQVSFTVSAPSGTLGKILVIRLGQGVLSDLDHVIVQYDNTPCEESTNVLSFFDGGNRTNPSWLRVISTDGLCIFIYVPHFSEHTITISSIITALSSTTALLIYVTVSIIAGIVFISYGLSGPVLRYMMKRKTGK